MFTALASAMAVRTKSLLLIAGAIGVSVGAGALVAAAVMGPPILAVSFVSGSAPSATSVGLEYGLLWSGLVVILVGGTLLGIGIAKRPGPPPSTDPEFGSKSWQLETEFTYGGKSHILVAVAVPAILVIAPTVWAASDLPVVNTTSAGLLTVASNAGCFPACPGSALLNLSIPSSSTIYVEWSVSDGTCPAGVAPYVGGTPVYDYGGASFIPGSQNGIAMHGYMSFRPHSTSLTLLAFSNQAPPCPGPVAVGVTVSVEYLAMAAI